MGQYHIPVCPDLREHLVTHSLDCGLKQIEILGSDGRVNAALAALIAVNPGNVPADLAGSFGVGRWAGQRLFFVGDYAEPGDVPGWSGVPVEDLYERIGAGQDLPDDPEARDPEVFCNIAKAMRGTLERARSERFVVRQSYLKNASGEIEREFEDVTCVPVYALARSDAEGSPHFRIETFNDERYAQYLERMGITEADVDRPPLDGSWAGITNAEVDQGHNRVIANLDRQEFIDPASFGDVPTTAGIMRGDSCRALTLTLFVPYRRGGGDLAEQNELPSNGRWRGERIVATSEFESGFPTTETVKTGWTDISQEVMRDLQKALS